MPETRPGGDAAAAVSRLLAEHGGRIYGLALRLCASPEEAEDLVQEVFLQAYRRWETFEGRSRTVFATLDLGRDACAALGRGELPEALRRHLERRLAA